MVLGFDFISDVKMIMNISAKPYSFLSNTSVTYQFQPGSASLPQSGKIKFKPKCDKTQLRFLSLISSVPPPYFTFEPVRLKVKHYIKNAVSNAHLQDDGKEPLQHFLEKNTEVCTKQPGRTCVFQHTI